MDRAFALVLGVWLKSELPPRNQLWGLGQVISLPWAHHPTFPGGSWELREVRCGANMMPGATKFLFRVLTLPLLAYISVLSSSCLKTFQAPTSLWEGPKHGKLVICLTDLPFYYNLTLHTHPTAKPNHLCALSWTSGTHSPALGCLPPISAARPLLSATSSQSLRLENSPLCPTLGLSRHTCLKEAFSSG